jgi:hypothetical protein
MYITPNKLMNYIEELRLKDKQNSTNEAEVEVDRLMGSMVRFNKRNKYIGAWTQGVMALDGSIRETLEKWLNGVDYEDFLYTVHIGDDMFYIQANGVMGYTAMLPSEY